MIFVSLTFSLPPTGDVLLQCLILNYLWVILANVLLVKVLGYEIKYKLVFYFGILLSVIGIIVACVGFNFNRIDFIKYFPKYYYCYCFAMVGAVSWAYYTVLIKKYSNVMHDDHIFISFIISGIICIAISFCDKSFNNYGNIQLDFKNAGTFLYEALVIYCVTYYFWSISNKHGNMKAIMNFSLLAPIISIISTSIFYNLDILGNTIYGSLILVAAIACCKYSICDTVENNTQDFFDEDDFTVDIA